MARPRRLIRRHRLSVRITHWINALSLFLLLVSGLQIFNAHPALYWGQASRFATPWLSMTAAPLGGELRGVTQVGSAKFDTTGVLGRSEYKGAWQNRGFPAWATLPPGRSLAVGRTWHFFFAWVFAVNGVIYLLTSLLNRHLTRDLIPTGHDLKDVPRDVVAHIKLKFPKGEEAARYQALQRIAYTGLVLLVLPTVALTGMTMSPGLNAAFPWLIDLFGGRQSARSIHFICASLIVAFVIVHLVMVLLTGPFNQVRGMITGKIAIEDGAGQ